jgi:hypothetical protein
MSEPIVVTGPPGVGKSTVAALVAESFPTVALVPGDAFFAFWFRGFIEPWLPESHGQNETITSAAGAAVGAYSSGCQVVYDGVLGPWLLPAFMAGAGATPVHYAVLLPPLEVCLARVAGRVGHPFGDLDAARHMHAQFATAGIEARHLFTDGSRDAPATAAEVLRRVRDGSLLLA